MLPKDFFSDEVMDFIRKHENEDPRDIVLKQKTIPGIPASFIADQIGGRRKAKEKLPLYYSTPGIIFPPSLNLEQSSSEVTAEFKAGFFERENTKDQPCISGADLTGGLGIDSYFLSRVCKQFHYVEQDADLAEIAEHNHRALGAQNITHHNRSAEDFLETTDGQFDLIFIDPSRRVKGNRKVYFFRESEPNIVALQELIFKRTRNLLVKASPLMDIREGLKELKNVKKVVVISVSNDCKELLFFAVAGFEEEPLIETVNIRSVGHSDHFDFHLSQEKVSEVVYSDPLQFLYEPNSSILKAGAFKHIGQKYDIPKLHPSTHLYTSATQISDFPGRIFEILAEVKPDPKNLKKFFPDGKANVITRNYPLSPDELKKKCRLMDGGESYLIGFSGVTKKYLAIARRIS